MGGWFVLRHFELIGAFHSGLTAFWDSLHYYFDVDNKFVINRLKVRVMCCVLLTQKVDSLLLVWHCPEPSGSVHAPKLATRTVE